MNKGLEALKRITLKDFILNDDSSLNDIKVIEKELEGYERILKVFGMKELANTERKLEALEIVKNKLVDVGRLYGCMVAYPYEKTPIHYNEKIDKRYKTYMITQKEYDLLKEVLL